MSERARTALSNTRVSGSVGLLWQNRGHGDDKRQSKFKRHRRETKYRTISQPQQVYKLTITYEKSGINHGTIPINCGIKRNNHGTVQINCGMEQFYIIYSAFSAFACSSPSSDSTACHSLCTQTLWEACHLVSSHIFSHDQPMTWCE